MRVLDDWLLTSHRVAVHEPTGTAVVADLHLGYCEARRARGDAIPTSDARIQLEPIRRAHEQVRFRRLLVAGDLFEKAFLPEHEAQLRLLLATLDVEWLGLIPGNHDCVLSGQTPIWPDGVHLGSWHVVHGDAEQGTGRHVMGHWHPCVRRERRKLPCFLVAPDCLILPAFSRDAAGVDVDRDRQWDAFRRVVIVGERLIAVGA
jgi:putative SbcD/Mre11-related phosphoesterase